MNKFHVLVFLAITSIFGGIVFLSQGGTPTPSENQKSNQPSLPPGDELQFLSNPGEVQNQEAQQEQTQQQTSQVQGPINASVSATIKTSKGNIKVILFGKEAQKTVENFINKAKSGYYKNLTFHRVEDWVVQGGDPRGNGTGGGAIQTELNAKPFLVGALGMAASGQMQVGQGARISNDSQFFITKSEADWLDSQYTNFGMVTQGMEIVNSIKIGDKILGITVE